MGSSRTVITRSRGMMVGRNMGRRKGSSMSQRRTTRTRMAWMVRRIRPSVGSRRYDSTTHWHRFVVFNLFVGGCRGDDGFFLCHNNAGCRRRSG